MDGITILNTIIVDDYAQWVLPTVLALGFVCIVSLVLMINSNDSGVIIFGIISLLAMIAMPIIIGTSKSHWRTNERNQYECIIDDSVSINEVYENYNVIERRGDIWVLEDKKNNILYVNCCRRNSAAFFY